MTTLKNSRYYRIIHFISIVFTSVLLIFSGYKIAQASNNNSNSQQSTQSYQEFVSTQLYLPMVQKPFPKQPIMNIPYFEGSEVNYHQAAVSWFGQVRGNENYADIRVGYNDEEIFVRVSSFDRLLWYDQSPDIYNLMDWDAVTIYLDLNGNNGYEVGTTMFRFTRQLQWWDDQLNRQISYQGNNSGWNPVSLTFSTSYGWKGNAPNDLVEDRGHVITFQIPFTSLGYTGAPPAGTKWGAAITLHDRDDSDGYTYTEKHWTQNFDASRSVTWGQFSFGYPVYTLPPATNPQEFTIRNGLNGANVYDGVVGGNSVCGQGLDFWWQWGDYIYPATDNMTVQNQGNIDDWPCYSKFYLTFPLDSLPNNQEVISATLTLHQSGQSNGFPDDPPQALNSLIQVSAISQGWDSNNLSWNNSPLPVENVSQAWVGFITMPELGKAYTWDVSRAVNDAYRTGSPLRLVIYSADLYGPNGKYFFTSDQEWEIMRPSLTVELEQP